MIPGARRDHVRRSSSHMVFLLCFAWLVAACSFTNEIGAYVRVFVHRQKKGGMMLCAASDDDDGHGDYGYIKVALMSGGLSVD